MLMNDDHNIVIIFVASMIEVQALQTELKQKEKQREELLVKLKASMTWITYM